MKTLTLSDGTVHLLARGAATYGGVQLAAEIGIGKSRLYDIIKNNTVTVSEATAAKIKAWLESDMADKLCRPVSKPRNQDKRPADPVCPSRPSRPVTAWDSPEFLKIAVMQLCKAVLEGRLKGVSIIVEGAGKCGD